MKIFKTILFAFTAIVLVTMAGCKKENKETQRLQGLVEQINNSADTAMSKGMILTKCEYKDGDSIFTYYVKVADKRFDKASQKEIKDTISHDLMNEKTEKIVKVLIENNLNLQYVFDTDSKTIPIVFSPEELKAIIGKEQK